MNNEKPVIYHPGYNYQEIYSGVPSFMGVPVAKTPAELEGFDFAVLGIPWEGGCTIGGFSSCTISPKTIRAMSIRYTGYLPDYDIDSLENLTACDYGDVMVQNGNYDLSFAQMRKNYGELLDAGCIPIVLGGDHSISYPLISEMAKHHPKKVGVLHFDAHLDNYPAYGDDPYARCSPFYQLYHDENMDPTKIVHIGIRGPRNHKEEYRQAKINGATVITSREINNIGWKEAIKKAIEVAKKDTEVLYVTVCSDVLDASMSPDSPMDCCGLTSFELASMLNECGRAGATSYDFVEIMPQSYGNQQSAHAACWMALYFMNGVAALRDGKLDQ